MYKEVQIDYDNPIIFDEDGYVGKPYCIFYEGNGLEFKYFPKDKSCYVCDILKDVEKVVVPESINTRDGLINVTKWNVSNASGKDTIKTILFGNNINEFTLATCEGFSNLQEVAFNANVKSLPFSFFKDCHKLHKISFCEDSPITEFDFDCFENCPMMNEITLPPKTSDVKFSEQKCFLHNITISYNQTDLIPQLIDVPCVKRIIVKSDNIQSGYIIDEEQILQRRIRKEEIKHERAKEKRSEEKRKSLFYFVLFVFNVVPFIYVGNKIISNTEYSLSINHMMTLVIQFGLLVICLILSYIMSYMIARGAERKLISLLSPVITVPLSILVVYVAINILSLIFTFSTELARIMDPMFL